MTDMTNWIKEDGIPHKNGKIKWFVMSFEEEGGHSVGEYDMTDWDKTFNEVVFPKAQEIADNFLETHEWQLIRGDHLGDLMFNVSHALYQSGDFKDDWLPQDYWDDMDEILKENDND
jgi:hypothetical protein